MGGLIPKNQVNSRQWILIVLDERNTPVQVIPLDEQNFSSQGGLKISLFSALMSMFSPLGGARQSLRGLNESSDLALLYVGIFFRICRTSSPYDSLNRKLKNFRLSNAVNRVPSICKLNYFCLAVFDWSNYCIVNSNFWPSGVIPTFRGRKVRKSRVKNVVKVSENFKIFQKCSIGMKIVVQVNFEANMKFINYFSLLTTSFPLNGHRDFDC